MISNNEKLPWIEKYRPNYLNQIESNNRILSTLKNLIENNKFPHLLFYGPPGTGKTSAILACANHLYNNSIESFVIHLNASDERGIDVVRERIKDFCYAGVLFNHDKPKLVILDEADSMTFDAQLALRQIVVNNTKRVRFCLICNYVNKIIPQLQSRFSKFRFKPIDNNGIINKLNYILNEEKINCDEYSINILANRSNGDMRKLINVLQSISIITNNITQDNLYSLLNDIKDDDIDSIINDLFNLSFNENYNKLIKIFISGYSLKDLIHKIIDRLFLFNLSNKKLINILKHLSKIDLYMNNNNISLIDITSLISVFITSRNL